MRRLRPWDGISARSCSVLRASDTVDGLQQHLEMLLEGFVGRTLEKTEGGAQALDRGLIALQERSSHTDDPILGGQPVRWMGPEGKT